MNIIDIFVILIIILFAYIGMRKGFVKSIVSFVGLILIFIIAYFLKNPIADWLCINMPFFSFSGTFKGATILNVIIYQILSFVFVFAILITLYHIVVKVSGLIERLLKLSFILVVPTKVGGIIVGILEGVVVSLIGIIVLSLPVLRFDLIENSAIRNYLYNISPIVGNVTHNLNGSVEEIIELKEKFDNMDNRDEFNLDCLDVLLNYKVLKVDLAEKLVYSEKLKTDKEKAIKIVEKYKD